MASQAQINANIRNSQRSTGPKTEAGKARARLNALKDGTHAKTVSQVLPPENAIELEQRINKRIADLNPRNDVERELVIHAAELAWTLDRAGRCETARLAHRVRKAQFKGPWGQTPRSGNATRLASVECPYGARIEFSVGIAPSRCTPRKPEGLKVESGNAGFY